MFEKLRSFAKSLKREIVVLASALGDPRTPLAAKIFGAAVIAYAVSPIDLIPDFIPVLGFLDELVLLPLCLWALKRLIPIRVLDDHRALIGPDARLPVNKAAALVIIAIWLVAIGVICHWLWDLAARPWIF